MLSLPGEIFTKWYMYIFYTLVHSRDGDLEDRPRSQGRPPDLILTASVSAAHVIGLGLGGPCFVYRVSRTGLGLEAGLET